MFNLNGKVALVTGASRGLGKGIALALANAGADIIVNYLSNKKEAEAVSKMIKQMGKNVLTVQADVSKEQAVKQMFSQVYEEFGRLDILINNAGTTKAQDITQTSLEEWDNILRINLTSNFLCSKCAVEIMKEQKIKGRIIQISSIVGQRGALFGHVHYASTKSGQIGFTKTLARTLATDGITVNAVAPGIIATELLYKTHGEDDVEQLSQSVPLGLGSIEDIGAAVVFLSSDEARYITGATLDVNGGMYLR